MARKVKVQIYGAQAKKTAQLEDGATIGATIGSNLYFADGTVVTLEELAEALGIDLSPELIATVPAPTLWSLIQGIPANVLEAAALTGDGVIRRETSGDWVTVHDPLYLTQTIADRYWLASEFVRGHSIIGVRYGAGPCNVYIPNGLPIEHIVTVKDEAGSGQVTVRVY